MAAVSEDWDPFETFESKVITILPEQYQDCYENVQPVSMRSAELKYADDGQVAWNEMWATFCDLAMAGGPPHKGTLLRPGTIAETSSQPDRYRVVVEEICRGITMVTDLVSEASSTPGWVCVKCTSEVMAGWLTRAIIMENVSARCERLTLYLPASPAYRIEKEIKNVITVVAKTCHYWCGHIPKFQKQDIAQLFARMEAESPLIQPALFDPRDFDECKRLSDKIVEAIRSAVGLKASNQEYVDWVGIHCSGIDKAIWLMRATVIGNVVSRREGTTVFIPVNPATDPEGTTVLRTVQQVYSFSTVRGIL